MLAEYRQIFVQMDGDVIKVPTQLMLPVDGAETGTLIFMVSTSINEKPGNKTQT